MRCRMAVAAQRRMTVVTRGSFCHSGLDPESVQILNQVQNDKVDSEHPSHPTGQASSG